MNKFRFALQTFSLIGLFFVFSSVAGAQSPRTWISATGDDANMCTRSAPCRTFAVTISKTTMGGEINCIDPGSYGAFTITKSITIDCEDTQGVISGSGAGSSGIIINITDPADTAKTARIRGITINGFGTAANGIKLIAANKVNVEEVVIDGFATHGVSILTSAGNLIFTMKNTTVRNNTGNGLNTFLTGAATAMISVESSTFAFNGIGFNQGVATTSSVQNSAFANNTTGMQASGSSSALGAKDCVIAHNTTGIIASTSATIRIGGNIITSNATGLSGTNIFTWGSNFIDGNITNGTNNGGAATQ